MLGCVADSTRIPGETDGGAQDTGRTGRNCSNSPNLQRSSRESRGPRQAPERDPTARMLLSCINKQQQLLRYLRPHLHQHHLPLAPTPPPLPEDPCPVKFSLATTANKTQLLHALNCEWHWQKRSVSPPLIAACCACERHHCCLWAGAPTGSDWMFAYA